MSNFEPLEVVQTSTVYRHFKGNFYYVHHIAADANSLDHQVVYQALYGDGEMYTRPIKEFVEKVDPEAPCNTTKQEFRFMPVADMKELFSMFAFPLLSTNKLVEELKKREGIETVVVEPANYYEVSTAKVHKRDTGATTILIVTD